MLGFAPSLTAPMLALPRWSVYVYSDTVVVATESASEKICSATMPFITRSNDTMLPNQPFDGTLEAGFAVTRSIVANDGYHGYQQTIAELSLINDGTYDAVHASNSINGQRVVVRVLEATGRDTVAPYAESVLLAELLGERWFASRARLTLEVRDPAAALEVPSLPSLYSGIGDLEGGIELANKRRPKGWGKPRNVTPALVIGGELLWQYQDGAVVSVDDVRDGGISLTLSADYATVALLRAAAIAPGSYATCIAAGYLRIGAAYKQITVDFTTALQTTADIIEAEALAEGVTLDDWTFGKLNDAQPAVREYYLGPESSETKAEMFTKLMTGIGGWWGITTTGYLQVNRMAVPVPIAAAYYDTVGGNIIDVDTVELPQGIDPPPRRWRVTHAHNWTVQTELYGQVSEADPAHAAYLASPYKIASTSDTAALAILADYPFAPDPDPVLGYFAEEADAQAEADRLMALYGAGRKAYRVKLKHALCVHQLGQVINVTDNSIAPRLGLDDGIYMRIVESNDNARDGTTELIAFGGL